MTAIVLAVMFFPCDLTWAAYGPSFSFGREAWPVSFEWFLDFPPGRPALFMGRLMKSPAKCRRLTG
jgi:hypothetical protein